MDGGGDRATAAAVEIRAADADDGGHGGGTGEAAQIDAEEAAVRREHRGWRAAPCEVE